MKNWPNLSTKNLLANTQAKTTWTLVMIDKLQELRTECDFPFIITSAYVILKATQQKSTKKNYKTHTKGIAVDILVSGSQAYEVVALAPQFGFTGIGVQQKGKARFIHLDVGGEKHGKIRPYIWSY